MLRFFDRRLRADVEALAAQDAYRSAVETAGGEGGRRDGCHGEQRVEHDEDVEKVQGVIVVGIEGVVAGAHDATEEDIELRDRVGDVVEPILV